MGGELSSGWRALTQRNRAHETRVVVSPTSRVARFIRLDRVSEIKAETVAVGQDTNSGIGSLRLHSQVRSAQDGPGRIASVMRHKSFQSRDQRETLKCVSKRRDLGLKIIRFVGLPDLEELPHFGAVDIRGGRNGADPSVAQSVEEKALAAGE